MFNLIPIMLLISTLAFRLSLKKKIIYYCYFVLINNWQSLNRANHQTNLSNKNPSKPEYIKAINYINVS